MLIRKIIPLLLLVLAVSASAVELDGKTVILLVSEHRTGDPKMESVKARLLEERAALGLSTEDMPVVFMGFKDSDTEREYFDRLGFQEFDTPVLCVVEWGNPARFGPKRVLDYAIYREATPQHVEFIVKEYLGMKDKDPDSVGKPPVLPPDASGELELQDVRFSAAGAPVYLTNAGVRIRNTNSETVRDIVVRFYIKTDEQSGWQLIGKKALDKLLSAHFASRDLVLDTREIGLVDQDGRAMPCLYRIEVEHAGKIMYREGEFLPRGGGQ